MAEGFAPPSPEVLDEHLTYVCEKYTLKGHDVLVHCRGGVGRAGLFSCGWMIKLGLVGSVSPSTTRAKDEGQDEMHYMQVVEKVIAVLRRRRSLKAIETPQQVHFILQYVEWLATTARVVQPGRTVP